MKTGKINKILNDIVSFTPSVTNVSGFPETNIIDSNSLKLWKVTQGTVTLVLQFATGFTADMVALFNVQFETSVKITTYSAYPATPIENTTFTTTTGLEFQNVLYELTNTTTTIVAIKLEFSGATSSFSTFCGYLWAGDVIDFGCAENIQPTDNTADQLSITRTNRADVNEEFDFQSYDVTLKKIVEYETLRGDIREIINDGVYKARPFILQDGFLVNTELLFGIFDAPTVKYDLFYMGDELPNDYKSQTTIGIREVTG